MEHTQVRDFSASSDTFAHRESLKKSFLIRRGLKEETKIEKILGVQKARLSLAQRYRHHDRIWSFFKNSLGMTTKQREIAFKLLDYYVRYPLIQISAHRLASECGCSVREVWYLIQLLCDLGLIEVINVFRGNRQRANIYVLLRLILAILRFLLEKGVRVEERTYRRVLLDPHFWGRVFKRVPT